MMHLIVLIILLFTVSDASANFNLLPLPPREEYGNLLINRTSTANDQKPVNFSHWLHRTKFTCRVCHGELDFLMKAIPPKLPNGRTGAENSAAPAITVKLPSGITAIAINATMERSATATVSLTPFCSRFLCR